MARYILEECSVGKYVKRLITLGAPNNGVAYIPFSSPSYILNKYVLKLCFNALFYNLFGFCSYMRPYY